jgi:uncharacterized coiled-coil DUF342 family protein
MLKRIKSLFIIEEPKSDNEKQTAEEMTQTETWPESSGIKKSSPIKSSKTTGIVQDEKFLDILVDLLEKNNQEGFDYLEFKQSLRSLKGVGLDEKTRYQSALAMAQSMGVKLEELFNSAESYLKILSNEENKFREVVKGQRQRLESEKKSQPAELEKQIGERDKKISELKKEIDNLKKELEKVHNDLVERQHKIDQTEQSFHAAYHSVSGQISEDVENMKKYLS